MTYKHTVVTDDLTDLMIHPEPLFGRLKGLWKEYLSAGGVASGWTGLKQCPACGSSDLGLFFKIWQHGYDRCRSCASVFLNPRPDRQSREEAFYNSAVADLIRSEEFQSLHSARFEKVVRPLLAGIFDGARKGGLSVLEVFGRDRHVLDYVKGRKEVGKYTRMKPVLEDGSGFSTSVGDLDEVNDSSCHLVLVLMSAEQMLTPSSTFRKLADKLADDGIMMVLARVGSGIDIQVLRGESRSVFPLEHMNLLSVEGFERLSAGAGLTVLELSTPGLLDAEHLRRYYESHPERDDIFGYFFRHRTRLEVERFQQFIQEVRLSSALKLICKRKGD